MCLAIPMKVTKKDGIFAIVESGGVKKNINISFLKEVKIGDYVIVHAGFAIEKLNEKRAKETLSLLKEMELKR